MPTLTWTRCSRAYTNHGHVTAVPTSTMLTHHPVSFGPASRAKFHIGPAVGVEVEPCHAILCVACFSLDSTESMSAMLAAGSVDLRLFLYSPLMGKGRVILAQLYSLLSKRKLERQEKGEVISFYTFLSPPTSLRNSPSIAIPEGKEPPTG